MESITNHGVHLSGNLEYTLLKNLDLNTSDNLDVSIASFDTQIGRFQPASRGTNNNGEMYDFPSGVRTKEANERSFVHDHQNGGDNVT